MPPAFEPHRFSTHSAPEHARIGLWQEQFGRNMLRVDVKPVADGGFHADATLRAFPGLRTINCATSVGVHYDRTKALLADGDDSIGIVVNLGPRAVVSHRGEEVVLGQGDALPIFTDAAAELTATRHLGLLFPRSALAERVRDLGNLPVRKLPRGSQPLRLLTSYFRAMNDKALLTNPAWRGTAVRHIQDLAALVLGPHDVETSLSAVAAARLAAVLELIRQRCHEPDLSAAAIARSQNISPRYLHRLIETTGKSFTAHVNELRLAHAYALLRDGANRERISDIALQSGFSDISYFNRLFRARFGDTPGAVRDVSGRRAD